MKKSNIIFFERKFPSANMILIRDQLPILIDTGFGSDVRDTEQLIKEVGVSPEELHLIVNTHWYVNTKLDRFFKVFKFVINRAQIA